MASKLSLILLASSLAVLLLVADASILRTTVAEIEEEDANPTRESCSSMRRLTPCMQWIKNTGSFDDEMNPGMRDMYKKQCCNMMYNLKDKDCMCSALKDTYSSECGRSESFQGRGMCCGMMTDKLMNVPKMCGFTKTKCHFSMLLV